MKRLLLTCTDLMAIQFLVPHVKYLSEHGFSVELACSEVGGRLQELRTVLSGIAPVHTVRLVRNPFSLRNRKGLSDLKKIINGRSWDVIWTNEPVMGVMTRVAAKTVRKKGTKVVYMVHGFHFYKGAPKKNWIVFYPIEKYFSRMTDKLITITKEDYHLASQKFHCKVERIHGVGVDENRYHSVLQEEQMEIRKQFGFTDGQKIILCVGELLPNKNQQMIIHAMQKIVKKYPDAQLLLAGNGSEKENLENLIKSLRLTENIKMLGYVTNLQEYQKIADVSVSCSKREGLPLNIVEAMLSGTPVVASVNRGHRELIQNGKNGFLIDVNDCERIADKVLKILTDKQLYGEIQKNANTYAQAYTFRNVKRELTKVYGFKDE